MDIRVIISVVLLLAILGGGLALSLHLRGVCDNIGTLLAQSTDNIRFSGKDDGQAFTQAMNDWNKMMPLICSLVIHDQVDTVNVTFYQAKGFLDSQTWGEYLACLEQLLFLMKMIGYYDTPTIRSIL